MEMTLEEYNSILQLTGDYKAALIMCKITLSVVLDLPDDAPLSIMRDHLQRGLNDIKALEI